MTMRIERRTALWGAAAWVAGVTAVGAQVPAKTAQAKRKDVLAPIEDEPNLPRILSIGDSISMGYLPPLREQMRGAANLHRPNTNCGPTPNGTANLPAWLGDKPWDVIHFNFGLHDLKYCDEKGNILPVDQGKIQVPLDRYEANLRQIVEVLKKTNAALIFATTTPVPEGANGRLVADAPRYNEAAVKIMQEHGVAVNDLFGLVSRYQSLLQKPKDVHFTDEGSAVLACQVALHLRVALLERKKKA